MHVLIINRAFSKSLISNHIENHNDYKHLILFMVVPHIELFHVKHSSLKCL